MFMLLDGLVFLYRNLVFPFSSPFLFTALTDRIPRSSCALMPLRTRGGEGEQKEGEGEQRPDLSETAPPPLTPLPRGCLSPLPSWPCMDGDGENRMLLPRG